MPPFHNCSPRTILLAALVMMGWGHTALAADLGGGPLPPLSAPPSPWTVTFTPYGWLTALNGDVTVKGRSVNVDIDAFELLDHLDAAPWMSYSEARRGPLALYSDFIYAKLGIDGSVSRSIRGLTVGADAGVDFSGNHHRAWRRLRGCQMGLHHRHRPPGWGQNAGTRTYP